MCWAYSVVAILSRSHCIPPFHTQLKHALDGCDFSPLLSLGGAKGYLSLPTPSSMQNFRKVMFSLARAASYFKGFRSEHIRMVFVFHFSSMCPVLKLFHLKNIFIFLFRFPLFSQHSFLSKEESSKAVLYMSDGGNLLSVIEIKDNGLYSAAVMHEHAVLKSTVRVRANYS